MGSSALGVSAGEKHRALLEGRYTRFARIIIGKSEICSKSVGKGLVSHGTRPLPRNSSAPKLVCVPSDFQLFITLLVLQLHER